jgi:hypothetical protein
VYHITPRKDNEPEKPRQIDPTRKIPEPTTPLPVSDYKVKVNVGNFSEDD